MVSLRRRSPICRRRYIVIYQWDITGNQIKRLRGGLALLGYAPPATGFSHNDWNELIHPEEQAIVQERITAALNNHCESYQVRYQLRHHNGDYQPVLETGWI